MLATAMAPQGGEHRQDNQHSAPDKQQNQKYDRQIRIWGEHGQAALQRASVCVFNVGPTGTETLKNLVLPGIGSFTVVDGSNVCPADAGNNFFLPSISKSDDSPTLSRALAATEALLELNDLVDGSYIAEDPSTFLSNVNAAACFVRRFSLVVVTQLGVGNPLLQRIAAGCELANVPLLAVRAYGLVGAIRVQVPEMCILDSRQDVQDLRLHRPFPSLQEFVDSFDLESVTDSTVASHVPFIVLLIKALKSYQKSTGTALPSTRKEKDEFVGYVKALRPLVCPEDAENFEEALKYSNVRLCYADVATVSNDIISILTDPRSDPDGPAPVLKPSISQPSGALPVPIRLSRRGRDSEESYGEGAQSPVKVNAADRIEDEITSFWLHAAGVRAFVDANDGQLPVSGIVPDMTADTKSYVTLQRLYATKADEDASEVFRLMSRIARHRGDNCHFDEATARDFCKRLRGIHVIRYRSMKAENENIVGSTISESIEVSGAADPSNSNTSMSYYVLLRAVDQFHAEHGWYPGQRNGSEEEDLRLLRICLGSLKSEIGGNLSPSLWCDEAYEVMRYSPDELHNVASYLGGVAAQEAVKIITRQFIPINNTMLISFANLTSASFVA